MFCYYNQENIAYLQSIELIKMAFRLSPGDLPSNLHKVGLNFFIATNAILLGLLVSTPSYGQRPANIPPDTVPPIDRGPRPEPSTPAQRKPSQIQRPTTQPGTVPTGKEFNVTRYKVIGSTVFSAAELAKVTQPFVGKAGQNELQNARAAVEKLYTNSGYLTTYVSIPPSQGVDGVINIDVLEGKISEIKVAGTRRVSQDYIRSRLRVDNNKPFNYDELVQAIGVLKEDPIVGNLDVEIFTGKNIGTNGLLVTVVEKPTAAIALATNNNQSANFGDWQRTVQVAENNLAGNGENISAYFGNTAGSASFGGSYSMAINNQNTRVSLNYNDFSSRLILDPFLNQDITSNTRSYSLGIRHPLLRRIGNNGFSEELGVGFSVGKSETTGSFAGVPTPLTEGADAQGRLNITALNFSQDYFQSTGVTNTYLSSNLRIGVDALGATPSQGNVDGRFVSWKGYGSYVNKLGGGNELVLQGEVQLADRPLLSVEQYQPFLRGYSSNVLLNDNGAFASTELRVPVISSNDFTLKAVPGLFFGTTWGSLNTPDPNALASAGLGLQLAVSNFNARLDWGVPLVFTNASKDNRLSFTVGYSSSF
jgi:hemolysin activation/secretion protein